MFTKEQYENRTRKMRRTFTKIAEKLGEDHNITKLMGCLAWGRNDFEQGASRNTVKTLIEEYGYLNGYYDAINHFTRDNDRKTQEIIVKIRRDIDSDAQ